MHKLNRKICLIAIIPVLNNQNDKKLESGELATDLMSALKEFEETTAKITSAHTQINDTNYQITHRLTDESMSQLSQLSQHNQTMPDEKGPIEYFNRTKETLRHVPQFNYRDDGGDRNTSGSVVKSASSANGHQQFESDSHELEESYVKIPVQQLINTFEKQMRSIIKQKINENIQLKLDGVGAATNNKMTPTYATMNSTNRDNERCDIAENGHKNDMNQSHEHVAVYATASAQKTVDFEAMVCQQQQQQLQHHHQQINTKQSEWNQETIQRTIVESTTGCYNNSYENKTMETNFDGGKDQAIYKINPTRFASQFSCSLIIRLTLWFLIQKKTYTHTIDVF